MATRTISGIEELKSLVGEEIGASDWAEVTQSRINAFADATEDHQWIHLDSERAMRLRAHVPMSDAHADSLEEIVLARESERRVGRMLARIDPRHRDAFILIQIEASAVLI